MALPVREWYVRGRRFADLHFYQKWRAVWPHLAALGPGRLRLLDAGCGDGVWAEEIATRRPAWTVVGIDRDESALARARERLAMRGRPNVSFEACAFDEFAPKDRFDVVLSICSAHYGATLAGTEPLFVNMRRWLAPGGRLVALVPRCAAEAPFVSGLARPRWHQVFRREDLVALCRAGSLVPDVIEPHVGRVGTLAKQLDWTRAAWVSPAGQAASAMARGLGVLDAAVNTRPRRSLLWVLVARAEDCA
ncbi:MAG: class I SAM-dependent methyltransferase [Acidobacteria bacterium]|nr:class I SAM-dependent methyltransferase [Acidobacteriota bacterium]